MTPIIGPTYALASRTADVQRAVGMYPVRIESGSGSNLWMLKSIPGLVARATGTGEGRGCFSSSGRAFIVCGASLYEVAHDMSLTLRGTLQTSSGPVDMDANMIQIGLVDGPFGYMLTKADNTFARITDTDFPGSARISFLDQFFVYANPESSTGAVYVSDVGDGSGVDALQFASAEKRPDPVVAHCVVGENLWVLGSESSEVWAFTGATFPLEAISGASSRTGCAATFSAIVLNNTVLWLGNDLTVWQSNGYQPARVSNTAVEQAIATSTDPASARAYGHVWNGSPFYCLQLPGLDTTWCLDLLTGQWHERAEIVNGEYTQHRAVGYMYAHGKHLMLGVDGVLYEMSDATHANGDAPLVRSRVCPHMVSPDGAYHSVQSLVLQLDHGSGGAVMVRLSKDGGASWGDWRRRSLGATGQRMKQIQFGALGGGRDLVLEIRCTDDVPFDLVNASLVAS